MVDFLEISSPAAQAIPDLDRIEVGSQIDPTLKNAMAHSSPTEDQVEALEPLFNEQDMLVPLNDLSQLDRIMADTPDHVVTDVAAHSDSESGEDPTPMAVDRITREDFTVPLNDIYASNDTVMTADTVALEDLTVPLNDITHFYQTPVAGRAATVHTRRQSTPFVRRMRGQPLPAQENTFGHEDEDEVEYGRAAPQDVAASSNDIPSSWLETRVPHDRTQQLKPPSPLAYSPLLGFQMDNIRTPQRVTLDSPLDARVAVEADEYSTPVELIAASDLPDVFDQKYLPARCHEEAEWDDRFGFAAVQQFIQGTLASLLFANSNRDQADMHNPICRLLSSASLPHHPHHRPCASRRLLRC